MRRIRRIILAGICVVMMGVRPATARVFLQITKNFTEKAEIVIVLQRPTGPYWDGFLSILKRDLEYSGYFFVRKACLATGEELARERDALTTELLLEGRGQGERCSFTVRDMLDEKNLFSESFIVEKNSRAFAHRINDEIIRAVTGKPGIARSRILFVSRRTGTPQIFVADYDGANSRQVTRAGYHLGFPRWLPRGRGFLFVSYRAGWPKIVRSDLQGGAHDVLVSEPGLNACVSIAPAVGKMALVLSKPGNPEVYLASLEGKILRRITRYRGVDGSPSLSPDGNTVAFVSDRSGKPQIYVGDTGGYRAGRISYGSGYCTSPAWSPDGRFIAYVVAVPGGFSAALFERGTGETVRIGEQLGCEDLSWAADSRHLVYTDSSARPAALRIIDVFTREIRTLTGPGGGYSPDWSR